MKWIRYQYVCNVLNEGTENEEVILLNKKVGYNEANLIVAQNEAYKGLYEIVEDEEVIELEPLEMGLGGTGAKTPEEAKKNLKIVDSFEVKITASGKISPSRGVGSTDVTYEEICAAIEDGKRVFVRLYNSNGYVYHENEFPLVRNTSHGCLFIGSTDYYTNNLRLEYSKDVLGRMYYITIGADSSVNIDWETLGGASVVHGSYVGTGESVKNSDGTYTHYGVGENEPNALSFPFKPKFVYITQGNRFLILTKHLTTDEGALDESNYDAYVGVFDHWDGEMTSSKNICIAKTFDGTYVEWYAYSDSEEVKPQHQMNSGGTFYEYIAWG